MLLLLAVASELAHADMLSSLASSLNVPAVNERRFGFGGQRATVDIQLDRVKEEPVYGSKEKRKFPVVWLRNQYPFNKKKKHAEPMAGYASEQIDVLDPNPGTWLKLDKPTASVKIAKQLPPSYADVIPPPNALMALVPQPLQPQVAALNQQIAAFPPLPLPLPLSMPMSVAVPVPGKQVGGEEMISAQSANAPVQAASYPVVAGARQRPQAHVSGQQAPKPAPSGDSAPGFGGISLSFGNGRSISFGGGQGLTIGGRAGAISIGGKGEKEAGDGKLVSYEPLSASGSYPSAGYNQQGPDAPAGAYGSGSSANYGKGYYKPSMSVEMPRKGKTVVHGKYSITAFMAPMMRTSLDNPAGA